MNRPRKNGQSFNSFRIGQIEARREVQREAISRKKKRAEEAEFMRQLYDQSAEQRCARSYQSRPKSAYEVYFELEKNCPKTTAQPTRKHFSYVRVTVPLEQARLFYRSRAWLALRAAILSKYGKVCMCCGDKESLIHVDHIRSLRRYWHLRLNPDNLQVLCELCNKRKGNTTIDFRGLAPEKRRKSLQARNFYEAELDRYAKQQIALYTDA